MVTAISISHLETGFIKESIKPFLCSFNRHGIDIFSDRWFYEPTEQDSLMQVFLNYLVPKPKSAKDSASGLRGATSSIETYRVVRPKIIKSTTDKEATSSMVPVRLSMEWSNLVTNVLLPSGSVDELSSEDRTRKAFWNHLTSGINIFAVNFCLLARSNKWGGTIEYKEA